MKDRWWLAALAISVMLTGVILPDTALSASPVGGAQSAPPGPPGETERCPVCGMFVAPFPTWTAALVLASGATTYFDGPKDLFRHRFATAAPEAKSSRAYVTEYYSTTLTAAKGLYYVVGSDVMGPMGHELVPVEGVAAAKEFLRDHKGKKIYTFEQITPELLSELP